MSDAGTVDVCRGSSAVPGGFISNSVRDLANFSIANDRAYLSEQPTMGGAGGYPGAIMGNFFGNHDQWRALTEAGGTGNPDAYRRLRARLL